MEIYDTLTKKLKPFPSPDEQKKINMFVCGPTVYDYIHIGNARTFVFFDVVAKYLEYKGYDLKYIQNITDIDNKIIERAQKEGTDPLDYAKKYSDIFKQDMQSLGVSSPDYKSATDHIPEVIKQVQTLLDNKNAYIIEGDGIYFDLSTFSDYGKLSGRTTEMANDAVSRIDDSDKKRNRGDFAIWKFSQPGDPSWPAPFGDGRPGWHIEDTAITEKYFGPQYDIHGGGQDLMFPHHEAEIAQQESVSGKKPFVKYWMHAGFLINKEQKMSKSASNFMTLHKALEKYSPETLRFYFLSAHYRSPLDFSEDSLKQAEAATRKLAEFTHKLKSINNINGKEDAELETRHYTETTEKSFWGSMDNDFNTPEAFGWLFNLVRNLNANIIKGVLSKETSSFVLNFLDKINSAIGIVPPKEIDIPPQIQDMAIKRAILRKENKWTEADKLRIKIEKAGYDIDDTLYGPLIKKK